MEVIRGKQSRQVDAAMLAALVAPYAEVLIDLGTGDGRFVQHVAQSDPTCFAIGIDACREQLHRTSRRARANTLYVIANALDLPRELAGLATGMTVNFPYGSLLTGLLCGEPSLMNGLRAVARPGAVLEVRLNGGALTSAGWTLQAGTAALRASLHHGGFAVGPATPLDARALRCCPSTWAKRLAFGRDPRGVYLCARCPDATEAVASGLTGPSRGVIAQRPEAPLCAAER